MYSTKVQRYKVLSTYSTEYCTSCLLPYVPYLITFMRVVSYLTLRNVEQASDTVYLLGVPPYLARHCLRMAASSQRLS